MSISIKEAFDAALAQKFSQPHPEENPYEAANRLGQDWIDLRSGQSDGVRAIESLRARWLALRKRPARGLISCLAAGMCVNYPDQKEFQRVREIQRKIHLFLPPKFRPGPIVQHFKEFSTGAEVFTAGIIDLSDPSLPTSGATFARLGYEICRQATSGSKLRLEHVLPAAQIWLGSLRQ